MQIVNDSLMNPTGLTLSTLLVPLLLRIHASLPERDREIRLESVLLGQTLQDGPTTRPRVPRRIAPETTGPVDIAIRATMTQLEMGLGMLHRNLDRTEMQSGNPRGRLDSGSRHTVDHPVVVLLTRTTAG